MLFPSPKTPFWGTLWDTIGKSEIMVYKHHFGAWGHSETLTPARFHQHSKQIPGLIQKVTARCCDLPFPEQACCAEEEVSVRTGLSQGCRGGRSLALRAITSLSTSNQPSETRTSGEVFLGSESLRL